ncbi:MAG TPA: response regulator transcription factor [Candidatus Angelobacter sp.]
MNATGTAVSGERPGKVNILVVAASSGRRALLAERLRGVLGGRGASVFVSAAFSAGRMERSHAEILVADLDGPSFSSSMLRFIQHFPADGGAVALTDDPQPEWVAAALNAGVNAIVSREADSAELRLAVEAADAGLVLLHPTSARNLIAGRLANFSNDEDEVEHLTAREREVLRLIGDGLGNKQIAARLGVSEHTAKFHTSSILGKLAVTNRTEAVAEGIRKGIIPI